MITGDNPLTAAAIAREAGVDDFLAQATPEDKLKLIRSEQAGGKLVAMTGDGTNDAPALAQADVGVAMNTGTQAAKEAGNMVDLDSNPTKLIEVVEIGKQLLMTRGALTTFSIANDVAKYFAIIPCDVRRHFSCAQRSEHHAPEDAAVGNPVRRDLQCINHHCADTPRSSRRDVSCAERRSAASAKSLYLWSRRADRPIRRYQSHRRDHHSGWIGLRTAMKKNLITAFLMTIATTILLGVIYPLVVTAIAQVLFKDKANGQIRYRDGEAIGSRIIAQPFTSPKYFHPRPSNAGTGYDAANSGGTNYASTNQKLIERVRADAAALHQENPSQPIPVDLLTTSASGLDPEISPSAAEFQIPRVARERGMSESVVRDLVQKHTYQRDLGLLGEPRVNVLELNLDLDQQSGKH